MELLVETSNAAAPYLEWRDDLSSQDERTRRFDQWLFLNAASVLLSEKTGELLAMSWDELNLDIGEVETNLQRLAGEWGFAYRLLHVSDTTLKFVVYQPDRLQEVLDIAPACVMSGKLNYHMPLTAESFIDEVRDRWEQHGNLPHEIGLALGYPIEDVFGYMGLMPLPCLGACGWRVYGCMQESQRRSCAYQQARCTALKFLAGAPGVELCA
ncbi:DUF3793 family protein [Cerasicoccus frondis]|uniref:DUF3793 family protein n=1 Tax=Cerasicoccus frondis TaxID=490090 RepID=UPI0028527BB3|nr:DUF3793 family protein [Cerasicoccus frondis]